MGNLFGKPKTKREIARSKVTDKDRAMLDLKNSRDRLKKYRTKLDKDKEKLTEQARALVAKQQKTRALTVLKLRKYKETETDKVEDSLLSVVKMIEDIEWESANLQVLEALKSGNTALHKLHEQMSADDVAELLEDTNEAIEKQNEIDSMLAGQFSSADDDELENELNMLMASDEDKKDAKLVLPAAPAGEILPTAPDGKIEAEEKKAELA
jgi:hypothetical protein